MDSYQESYLTLSNSFIAKVNCLKIKIHWWKFKKKQSTNDHKYVALNYFTAGPML